MSFARTLAMSALLMMSAAVAAGSCDSVVEDTVAEMRAGAGAGWSSDLERAVRAAAGSACVKAQSGRYEGQPQVVAAEDILEDEPMLSSSGAAATAMGGDAVPQASDAGDEEEDGFSIGGLTIRGASGSPSKKSYERSRDSKVDE